MKFDSREREEEVGPLEGTGWKEILQKGILGIKETLKKRWQDLGGKQGTYRMEPGGPLHSEHQIHSPVD